MNSSANMNTCVIPHKSTTHDERFYHIRNKRNLICGTVFFRKEDDGTWNASVALRSPMDAPNKRTGRTVARRKYFAGKNVTVETADYEVAQAVYNHAIGAWLTH